MSRDLYNLIRLHKWHVNEKQRKLGEMNHMLNSLESQAQALENELANEQKVAAQSATEAGLLYGNYAEAIIERRKRLAESISQAENAIAAAREELATAYQELKKYELTQENRNRRAAMEQTRKEQMALDEIALQTYRKKNT